jgi:hypothetical protein
MNHELLRSETTGGHSVDFVEDEVQQSLTGFPCPVLRRPFFRACSNAPASPPRSSPENLSATASRPESFPWH